MDADCPAESRFVVDVIAEVDEHLFGFPASVHIHFLLMLRARHTQIHSVVPVLRAHSATIFGDQQLFSEMTLGTFPSMAPYQKSCWHSLYFNCGQVKLDPQKPLFFTAFWV